MKTESLITFLSGKTEAPKETPVFASHYRDTSPGIFPIVSLDLFEGNCIGMISPHAQVTTTLGMLRAICSKPFTDFLFTTEEEQIPLRPLAFDCMQYEGKEVIVIHYMNPKIDKPEDVKIYYASIIEQLEGTKHLVVLS